MKCKTAVCAAGGVSMLSLKRFARIGSAIVIVFSAIAASTSLAQVKPDDVISTASSSKIKDLVSPGVYQQVQQGIAMKIVETQHIDWPPPYKDATEKYSGQAQLSPDNHLANYTAGLPFPTIDPNDPAAAAKIMWNGEFQPVMTDYYCLRFVDCEFGYIAVCRSGHTLESIF